jgi:ABC-2 type transport system permease protein
MQQVGAIFPLKWMTQAMRSVFLPDSFAAQEVAGQWEIGKSFAVISIWLVIGLIFSSRTFRWSDR